jgi:hypothetical protein
MVDFRKLELVQANCMMLTTAKSLLLLKAEYWQNAECQNQDRMGCACGQIESRQLQLS